MHPALLRLVRLQVKGWLRRQFHGGAARRLFFGLIGGIAIALWLGTIAFSAALRNPAPFAEIMAVLPLGLTALALMPLISGNEDRAIAFSPAEIDFLFPGPFSRRQIVLFKLLKIGLGSIGGGALFGLFLRKYAHSLPTSIVGAILSLVQINLAATIFALVRGYLHERFYRLVRAATLLALLGGGVAVVWLVNQSEAPAVSDLKTIGGTLPVMVLTAPARPFAHVFAAESPAECLGWIGVCLAMMAVTVLAILSLDKGYLEAAVAASARRHTLATRQARGVALKEGRSAGRLPLPALAALGPARAIVRRQLIAALRTYKTWLVAMAIFAAMTVVMSRMTLPGKNKGIAPVVFPVVMMAMVMLPQIMRFDFRGDLDQMGVLKSLPLTSRSIVLAELAVPTALIAGMICAVVAAAAWFAGLPARAVLVAVAAAPLLSAMVIALENLAFLVMPTRLIVPGQAGVVFSGRRIVMAIARVLLLLLCGGVVAAVSGVTWALTRSFVAAAAAGWAAMFLVVLGVVGLAVLAYNRFDVSVDTPT